MRRLDVATRPNWQKRFDEMGFSFHSMDGIYWREGVCYEFTSAEIDYLEEVTTELHKMCLEAVDHVVRRNLFPQLGIPETWEEVIRQSWTRGDRSLYGRFDLAYDGQGEAKLLEYNADTPTALFESSIAQWIWLEDLFPGRDQFNSIHEKLADAFQALRNDMPLAAPLFFTCVRDHEEDFVTVQYLRDVAMQAGIDGRHIFIDDIGYSGESRLFHDLDGGPIEHLFKLYPWEWLLAEDFGRHLQAVKIILEPAWKLVLSSKGILPILWRLNPGHPNLLPADFSPLPNIDRQVKKPLFSREGANIAIVADNRIIEETGGTYGREGFIYQQYQELPRFADNYALIGSWIVNGLPAGIGIREDATPITKNSSTFVPHFFNP